MSPSNTTASNTRPQKRGLVLIDRKWERLLHFAFVTIPGAGGDSGVRPCSWCSIIARASALQTFPTSLESIDREDFGTGINGVGVATVLEDRPRLDLELIKALGTYDRSKCGVHLRSETSRCPKLSSHRVVRVRRLVGLFLLRLRRVLRDQKRHGYGPRRRYEFDGEDTASEKESRFQKVGPRSPP
ncbi:hypothetical protein GWK47_031204 [Chionoecetes opilio]|uniref:Uncharacterized protein n=1 Tax=Chionoecetes opilio TaxID=41210 RepID=A0A8J4YKH4_CHIOP|nr:hypothetical protein GWK47_031204 [Chionoecetes opilio]